ncbi:MAG: efflux RND transporter periplasmic adaptor subunit [Acidobacteria bacterium]|nr:MAG: efflux RND transporter periplasmic adaptor subunit [Acidobacteriota bacterium]
MLKSPRHRFRLILSLVPVLGLALNLGACRESEPVETARAEARAPVEVQTAVVQGRDEPVVIEATGSFEADELSKVAPEASGRVVATPVDIGQFVRAGAVLVRLQATDAGLRLDEARAAVSRAEANLKLAESRDQLARTTAQRYQALLATGDVSKTVADQARTEAETAQQTVNTGRATAAEARAQLAQAEKAVADVAVTAPFAGFVAERHVAAGEYVQPSTPVVTLVKIDPLRLRLTIPAVQAAQVSSGQRVFASVDAFPGNTFEGTITAVAPAVAAESRALTVEARVPNPRGILKPGMFAVTRIDQGRTARALLVPRAAVVEDVNTNSYRVFAVDEQNRVRVRVVQLAPRQGGDMVRLASGVEEGDRVVVSNLGDLFDSAPVRAVPAGSR